MMVGMVRGCRLMCLLGSFCVEWPGTFPRTTEAGDPTLLLRGFSTTKRRTLTTPTRSRPTSTPTGIYHGEYDSDGAKQGRGVLLTQGGGK